MKKSMGSKAIACPSPVWCIGTYDGGGKPNLMTASWAGICCSKPPAVSVSLRKATYTYGSLRASKAFTVNVPSKRYVREADYVGLVSGKDVDKFAATGLTAVRSDKVDAPYVAEFPLVIECRLIHEIELGLHTQFVGEIVDVLADEAVLNDRGRPDIARIDPFVFSAADRTYHTLGSYEGDAFSIGRDRGGDPGKA